MDTPEGRGTVVELDLLRQRVKVRMEDSPETIALFANADIAVLRSGKAKKNDLPIPADLAPISGIGKRARKEQEQEKEEKLLLEPIRFRYSTEQVVEEKESSVPETAEEAGEGKPSRSRRRRRGNGEGNKSDSAPKADQPKEKKEHKAEQPKEKKEPKEGDKEKKSNNNRRRPNHRRRKPKPQAEG